MRREILGFVAVAGLATVTATARDVGADVQRYEAARKLVSGDTRAEEKAEGAKRMRELSEKGYSRAQGYYGFLLARGIGVAKDEAGARQWLQKAADQGLGSAQLNLGLMILEGKGGEKDLAKGLEWIVRAAEGGEVQAQVKLAEFAYFGHEAYPQNDETSAKWAKEAAEQGDAWSQNLYGTLLESGKLGTIDRKEAMAWYRKAAEQGNAKAQASLGRLLESGLVGERDIVEAYYWLWQGVEQGEPNAINYLKDLVPGMTEEERKAALKRIGQE